MAEDQFRDIEPNNPANKRTSNEVNFGVPIPKSSRVGLFSPDQWEEFVEEWASSLKREYATVKRFAGSGDKGLDVVGFTVDSLFSSPWDNYQCKHYAKPLSPSDIWIEIGKIIYYSHVGEYTVPRKSYFVASKGIGTSLGRLLSNPSKLKEDAKTNWPKYCEKVIIPGEPQPLADSLLNAFENFDFSIFDSKSVVQLIEGHTHTSFHSVRFGGGLPARPATESPPEEIAQKESRYINQLYGAYGDHLKNKIKCPDDLVGNPSLQEDFLRQRERFYDAESLRNFARDSVPPRTFENLQDEIFQGVIDVCEQGHIDGLRRMRATIAQAAATSITASPLISVLEVNDKQGICHQLANVDRLLWVKDNGTDS